MSLATVVPPTPANGAGVAGTFLIPLLLHLWGFAPILLTIIGIIGGMMGIIWYTIMIMESETVKTWRRMREAKRKVRRIAKLKAEERIISAELAMLDVPLDEQPMKRAAEAIVGQGVPVMKSGGG